MDEKSMNMFTRATNNIVQWLIEKDTSGSFQNLVDYKGEKENPMFVFGPGVFQYFRYLEMLSWMFGFLSILAVYQMYLIRNHNPEFIGQSESSIGRQVASYSLGAFSEIQPICWKVPYN